MALSLTLQAYQRAWSGVELQSSGIAHFTLVGKPADSKNLRLFSNLVLVHAMSIHTIAAIPRHHERSEGAGAWQGARKALLIC